MKLQIQKATQADADQLTEIAFAAKRTWDYPKAYFEIWKEELTITKLYIQNNWVYNAVLNGKVVGFYSIIENMNDFFAGQVFVSKGFWLEHLFIQPEFQHKGIGGKLVEHAIEKSKKNKIKELLIFVDPNAIGFYEKLGATFIQNSKSSIPDRDIPIYCFDIEKHK